MLVEEIAITKHETERADGDEEDRRCTIFDVLSIPTSSERVNENGRGEKVITYFKLRRMSGSDATN